MRRRHPLRIPLRIQFDRENLLRLHSRVGLRCALYRSYKQPYAARLGAQQKLVPGFTAQYNVTKLVCYEVFDDVRAAIQREKQIKRWSRAKKVSLIEKKNPRWLDLFVEQPMYDELPDELD